VLFVVSAVKSFGLLTRIATSYGVPLGFVETLIGVNVAVGNTVPGPGVRGVLVGGRVAVGVTRLTGMRNNCPTNNSFGFVMSFSSLIASMVLLKKLAIPANVAHSVKQVWM
jgi:hypothetical protein